MKFSHKIAHGLMIAGTFAFTASAAELFKAKAVTDFQGNQTLKITNGVFSFESYDRNLHSAKTFVIDPAKTYKLTASVRATAGTSAPRFYIGFVCLDKDGKDIHSASINAFSNTLTTLAAPVKKGDKVIKVKDASKWKADTTYRTIVFNAQANLADLPNNTSLLIQKDGIAKAGNVWEIKLQKPATQEYAAGINVREHTYGGTYLYLKHLLAKADWATMTGTIKGIAATGSHFWPGTKSVRVLVMTQNMKKGMAVEFKDVILEEVK